MAFSLNGLDLTSARATLVRSGVWHVDAVLVEALELAGGAPVQLVLGDLVLVGTALPGGTWAGSSSYTIVGGAGGWARSARAAPAAGRRRAGRRSGQLGRSSPAS